MPNFPARYSQTATATLAVSGRAPIDVEDAAQAPVGFSRIFPQEAVDGSGSSRSSLEALEKGNNLARFAIQPGWLFRRNEFCVLTVWENYPVFVDI